MISLIKSGEIIRDRYLVKNRTVLNSKFSHHVAWDKKEGKQCLIKQYYSSAMTAEEILNFEKIFIKGNLSQYLVRYDDVFTITTYPNSTFFVMEYCENGIHSEKFKNIDSEKILEIFSQLVISVFSLHSCGVIHGNIKPQTVFVDENGMCKFGDYTIFEVLVRSLEKLLVADISWMAPELRSFKKCYSLRALTNPTFACDLFSLGVTAYALFEGHLLPRDFDSQTLQFNKDFPSEIKDMIRKLVSEMPKDRPNIEVLLLEPLIRKQISLFRQDVLPPALLDLYARHPGVEMFSINHNFNPQSVACYITILNSDCSSSPMSSGSGGGTDSSNGLDSCFIQKESVHAHSNPPSPNKSSASAGPVAEVTASGDGSGNSSGNVGSAHLTSRLKAGSAGGVPIASSSRSEGSGCGGGGGS